MPINNFTLLYVENNLDIQDYVKSMIQDNVKEFYQAFDGKEGLAMYKEFKPDILLTDIEMPILDGLSMIEEIKTIDDKQPIIIVSAFDNRENLLKAINIGVDTFALKPIDIDVIYKKIGIVAQNLKHTLDNNNKIHKLYNLAYFDTLTKIPNRLLFNIELDQAISKAKEEHSSFRLFFIDLDNFKNINDTYGHIAGDKILQNVASSIKKVLSINDIFARISGDEFSLIVQVDKNEEYINNLLKRILKASSSSIEFNDHTINFSCTIGVSQFPQDTNSKETLLHLADAAMYKAKKLKNHSKMVKNKVYIDEFTYWNKIDKSFIYNNEEVLFTNKEEAILSLLFNNINQTNSYNAISLTIWKDSYSDKMENIKTLVKQIRRKLPIDIITNVFGIGYKIEINN